MKQKDCKVYFDRYKKSVTKCKDMNNKARKESYQLQSQWVVKNNSSGQSQFPQKISLNYAHIIAIALRTQCILKLEAFRERRPPWPRQIITLILPTVKMLSLGCERLPTP